MKSSAAKSPASLDLPRFLGVKEVCEAFNFSRSTLDRLRRDKAFPEAAQLSPNRVGWTLETLKEWAKERSLTLTQLAVSDPQELEPGEMLSQAQELILKSMEMQGRSTDGLESMSVTLARHMTLDEFRTLEMRELANWSARFAKMPEQHDLVVAAWLFPNIRRLFLDAEQSDCHPEFRQVIADDNLLEHAVAQFLRDGDDTEPTTPSNSSGE